MAKFRIVTIKRYLAHDHSVDIVKFVQVRIS